HFIGLCMPFILMPAPSEYPLSWLSFIYRFFHFGYEFLIAGYVHQVKIKFVIANTHEVTMSLNKTRRHGFTLQVNYFRFFTDVFSGFSFLASKFNDISVDHYRFNCGLCFINCIDCPPQNDLICRLNGWATGNQNGKNSKEE